MENDWPEYYRNFIGGGTRSHPPLCEFEVYVVDQGHPIMKGLPDRLTIVYELYRFERDEEGADMHVLVMGIEEETGEEYPVVWAVEYGNGQVVPRRTTVMPTCMKPTERCIKTASIG